MDRLLSPAIAATGLVAGLLLATGYRADAVTPLLLALATAAAVRIYRHRFGQRHWPGGVTAHTSDTAITIEARGGRNRD